MFNRSVKNENVDITLFLKWWHEKMGKYIGSPINKG